MRAGLTVGAAVLAAAVCATSAGAATVRVDQIPDPDSKIGETLREELVVTAGAGEANVMTVRLSREGTVAVTDAGAPLLPGQNCRAALGRVECDVNDATVARLSLGDRADRLTLSGLVFGKFLTRTCGGRPVRVQDGPGDDVVFGSRDGEVFLDGPGDDNFIAGRGEDVLVAGPGADRFSGGRDGDVACYAERVRGVRVSLDGRRNDGRRGERDGVERDVEAVVGGRGGDRLSGNRGRQRLAGGRGRDVIRGGGGRDILRSGPGADRVFARDGRGDSIFCSDRRGSVDRVSLDLGVDRTRGCRGA